MNFFSVIITSSLLLTLPANAHKFFPVRTLSHIIYKSKIRGDIPCMNRVIIAAEQVIDKARINPKQYESQFIDLALFYTRYGSTLAKYHNANPYYQKVQDIIIKDRNLKKANELLFQGWKLQNPNKNHNEYQE